ncbi:TonB-dependent receptor [Gluconacetobacter johannae DSM 13595]|uniref:TonB-dependent receptor n=1 Tax=Gluconacetobacter johannae TaxID=112140 RepID=A0A7W4P590_9PROT|nr:TonB-dependent receptor [Gluconacetobacter johannae]MBB2174615.1 TonB-dependent receptor [Gluconacetobacter johannae]GBQ88119.1 TonB-dependent receptor [Gluconacetobacter johannae DSM 13595]
MFHISRAARWSLGATALLGTVAHAAPPQDGTPATTSQRLPATENIIVTGANRAPATIRPAGQTTYSADRSSFGNQVGQTVADMVVTIPGVSFTQGNGPRDTVVSVRGSGDRQSYGLKNLQILEDGFPMTQSDGTARADLIDPHAYEGVDVFEGPASTVYGNYAINGAINFRTRKGADIHGLELGSDFGSFGMFNNYVTLGLGNRTYDLMVFGSDVRGQGFIANSSYNTSTENMRLRVNVTPSDRLILKVVNNITDAFLPVRLSLSQFRANPFQQGCQDASHAAPGCAFVNLLVNGRYGAKEAMSPQAAGLGRFDRRTVVGLRWEHDFNTHLTWRNQFTYDQRHVDQPTSPTAFVGPYNSYNVSSDMTHQARIGGTSLETFGGVNFDYLDFGYQTYNVMPSGGATRGAKSSESYGHQWNLGARFQEDWHFAPRWHAVVGLGGTYSDLGAAETLYGYSEAGATRRDITANRFFFNLAPEGALIYTPTQAWTLHTRVGTAYGTPSSSNLFITPQGTYGNNTQLKSQTSVGVDVGADWRPTADIHIQATGFYEFYNDELVSQSAGVNTVGSYTFNAPASQHRGIVLGADWKPLPKTLPGGRMTLGYTYDNQVYTNYAEVLSNSTMSRSFSRKGNRIPGVIPNFLNARFLYTQPDGPLEGLGGYAEVTWRDAYWLDNANRLKAPGYALLNLEIHYDPPKRFGWTHRLHWYFEVQNVANETYVAGATNISDTLLANGRQAGGSTLMNSTGSIYAGSPRAYFGGVRIRL